MRRRGVVDGVDRDGAFPHLLTARRPIPERGGRRIERDVWISDSFLIWAFAHEECDGEPGICIISWVL